MMKNIFKPGDRRDFTRTVQANDTAIFNGEQLHPVCSTFSLARDFEWCSRLFFLEMKEEDEEGVGTHLRVDHKSPAFVGELIHFVATVEKIEGFELFCTIEAKVGHRLIATGTTGQKMLKKEKLKRIFDRNSVV